ncbi:MAG: 4'-phosphopantetheinyl transferase superfamily protein [Clostridia bacterium]|nr:4'-phosphopantetheinyl transferase superfamily protein [Clostridia bacterium]
MTELHAIRTGSVRGLNTDELQQKMPERMKKAARFVRENDRLLCLGGGLLMLRALGLKDEKDLRFGAYQKPSLPGGKEFNLSHSGEWCLLAVSGDGPVGVDLEKPEEANLSVARSVYTDAELRWMEEAPLERFHRLWTWKESVMKAPGLGLALEPKRFDVTPFIRGDGVRIGEKMWFAFAGTLEGCPFSLCTGRPAEKPAAWEWIPAGDGLFRIPLNYIPFAGDPREP